MNVDGGKESNVICSKQLIQADTKLIEYIVSKYQLYAHCKVLLFYFRFFFFFCCVIYLIWMWLKPTNKEIRIVAFAIAVVAVVVFVYFMFDVPGRS